MLTGPAPSSQIIEYLAGYKNDLSKAPNYLIFIYLQMYFDGNLTLQILLFSYKKMLI